LFMGDDDQPPIEKKQGDWGVEGICAVWFFNGVAMSLLTRLEMDAINRLKNAGLLSANSRPKVPTGKE